MIVLTTDEARAEFAARRKAAINLGMTGMRRAVARSLQAFSRGEDEWWTPLVNRGKLLARADYRNETGQVTSVAFREALEAWEAGLVTTVKKTHPPTPDTMDIQTNNIALSISTSAHNLAMNVAAEDLAKGRELGKTWLSMDDDDVREEHQIADGQKVPVAQPFVVGGVEMMYPGDMSAPIELWINCRCVIGIEYLDVEKAIRAGGDVMDEDEGRTVETPDEPLAWHGVLAPEDVVSGDGRKFASGALRFRDLPLPLKWMKVDDEGHKGSVTVGRIDDVWRKDGQMRGTGVFLASVPEADEAIGLLAEGGIRGVSVDADDGTMEMQTRDGTAITDLLDRMEPGGPAVEVDADDMITVFSDARICGATLVPIPAFQEAYVNLGQAPPGFGPQDEEEQRPETDDTYSADPLVFRSISEKPWDGSPSRFTDDEWFRSTIMHLNGDSRVKSDNKFPILEPGGALSRAAVHNAAARISQTKAPPAAVAKAKAALRTAYRELKDELPDNLKAGDETDQFGRGPGWITHPVPTRRIHDYWTKPGHAGYSKIRWGVPGDFNRCRREVGEEIAENSPDKTRFLNQICAQWHYDALGWWPGRPTSGDVDTYGGVAVHLVASGAGKRPPASWFADPHLTGPSPVVVTEDRRVFGHLATWGTCHIGLSGVCTTAPKSVTDYAYFHTGSVLTDEGEVAVGHITMDTGHADQTCSGPVAAAHYDDTGHCVADVVAGEDEYGIWVAGAVREAVPEESVAVLRGAALSGDWRRIGGSLELVAALAVNVPGFPIPRTSMAASAGVQTSLVAAGVLPARYVTKQDIKTIVREAIQEYEAGRKRRLRMAELRMAAERDPRSRMKALAGRRH